jgi:hypothetical protein
MIDKFFLKNLPGGLLYKALEQYPRWEKYGDVHGNDHYEPPQHMLKENTPEILLLEEWHMRQMQLSALLKPLMPVIGNGSDETSEAIAGFYFAMLDALEGLDDIIQYIRVTNRLGRTGVNSNNVTVPESGNGGDKKGGNPEKSESEPPQSASQPITEQSCARGEHPYPLPANVASRVSPGWFRLLNRYANGWTPEHYLPLVLTCFETWALRVKEQAATVDSVCQDVDSAVIWGIKHSLERLCDDFNVLLGHSRWTLPFDPWLALNTHDSEE